MSRPVYQGEADEEREERCARMLTGLGYNVLSLDRFSAADFIAQRNGTTYLIEYKFRNHNFGQFPTSILPVRKLQLGKKLGEFLKMNFVYLAEYLDGYYWSEPEAYTVMPGGRTDRGDAQDLYPMAHISTDQFIRIK